MQYMQKIQKYAKICTIIPYMDSCIYMRYMRQVRVDPQNPNRVVCIF